MAKNAKNKKSKRPGISTAAPTKHPVALLSPKLEKELQRDLLDELSTLDEIDGKNRRLNKAFKTLREYHEAKVYSIRRQLDGYESPQIEIPGTNNSKSNLDLQMKNLDTELERVGHDAHEAERAKVEEQKAKFKALEKAGSEIIKNGTPAPKAEQREPNLGT